MGEIKTKGARNIQSIERAYRILECFIENEELGLTEISNLVGLHKSTTNGIVTTLRNLDILQQNPQTSKFSLGRGLYKLYSNINMSIKDLYQPYMKKLSDLTEETVTLHSWNGGETTTLIDIIESSKNLRYSLEVGDSFPCNTSAIGKSILAFLDIEERNRLLDKMQLNPITSHTITDRRILEKDLEEIKVTGYGITRGEAEDDIVGLGIPIFDKRFRPIGGIGVGGPSSRITDEVLEELGLIILNIKRQILKEIQHI